MAWWAVPTLHPLPLIHRRRCIHPPPLARPRPEALSGAIASSASEASCASDSARPRVGLSLAQFCVSPHPAFADDAGGDARSRLGRGGHRLCQRGRLCRSSRVCCGDSRAGARSGWLSRGRFWPAGLALVRTVDRVRQAGAVFRNQRRQHGLDDQPLHRQPQGCATTTRTRPAGGSACVPTGRRSPIASGPARPTRACQSSRAGSKLRCAAWPTTTIGPTR
jgi:hypothetical protein